MSLFPKFIIEDGCIILAKVTYHKEIAKNKDNVRGGGWFRFESKTNTFTLYGKSEDFGPARLVDIQTAVSEGKVYNRQHSRSLVGKYNFAYDTGSEILPLP